MAIYECECGFKETVMSAMRSHLKSTGHGKSATYGEMYRLVKVHIKI